jgi:hypothetical protein
MSAREVEPERLGALNQFTEMSISSEQVLDQLATNGLLPTDHLTAALGMSLGKGGHGIVDDLEQRTRCCPNSRAIAFADG